MSRKKPSRWVALVGAGTIVAGVFVAVQVAGAAPAAAVPGLHRVESEVEPSDSRSHKQATAYCPTGEQVVGGGGWVYDFGAGEVVLTRLQPLDGGAGKDAYAISAEEPPTGFAGVWWLQAYALCSPPLPGHGIVVDWTDPSSSTFKTEDAVCTNGRRVIGTGAQVNFGLGYVGLHLSRAAGPLDISRASARERVGG